MKKAIFILPFLAILIWLSSAQRPFFQFDPKLQSVSDTLPIAGNYPQKSISTFLDGDFRSALHLSPADGLRLLAQLDDGKGGTHARLQQTHNGIPVFGAWYNLHEHGGQLSGSNGHLIYGLDVPAVPGLNEADALAKALSALPADRYAWQDGDFQNALRRQRKDPSASFFPKGELVIAPRQLFPSSQNQPTANYRLAWSFEVYAIVPDLAKEQIFVDALDGSILHRLPQIANCNAPAQGKAAYVTGLVDFDTDSCNSAGTQKYRLHDPGRSIEIFDAKQTTGTPPFSFFNQTTLWTPPQADTVAIAALWGLTQWYDYFYENFNNWKGFDGLGNLIQAWVHHGFQFPNAFYDGNLHFGDGKPGTLYPKPLVSLDVCSHEATHGVIGHTCGLLYVYEPGILNEGIADIFGCLVEWEAFENGLPVIADWQLGEDIAPAAARRLDFPNLLGLPDTYGGDFWMNQSTPNEALHKNSTVLGHWFYLLSEGGSGFNDLGTAYSVDSIGRDEAAQLLFHTMRFYLNPADGFYDFRNAVMAAASSPSFAWTPDELDNLGQAFCAIGVGGCEWQGANSITLTSPNGGVEFEPGEMIPVTWTNSPGVTAVQVIFSVNGGASWQVVLPNEAPDGSAAFPAPNVQSHLCRVRVSALNDPLAFDASDNNFTIIGCDLLANFSVIPESGCFGTDFSISNGTDSANVTWFVDGVPYTADINGFTLVNPLPGPHVITLVAQNAACTDTLTRTITVAPVPSAAFNVAVSNFLVTAAASFSQGEQYFWSVNGEVLAAFNGSQSMVWTAPDTGTFEVCLFVGDNCSGGGEEVCQEVVVEVPVVCSGTDEIWKQYNNKSEVNEIAAYGDTLIISTTGGLLLYDKNIGQVVKVYNTISTPALPCQEPGSIAVDRSNGWIYVALPSGHINGFVKIDLTTNSITHFTKWNLPNLLSNHITVLKVDEQGILWIGTDDNGVWTGVPGISFDTIFIAQPNGLPNEKIVDIDFAPDGTTWVATREHLSKIENGAITAILGPTNSPLPPFINTLMVDSNIVWVGTGYGLFRLEGADWEVFNNFSNNFIVDIIKGANDKLYFGFPDAYFIEYDGIVFTTISCLSTVAPIGSGDIRGFVSDDYKLWVGCLNGLFSWSDTESCQHYSLSDFPIRQNSIDDILLKSDGSKFVMHRQSIVKINNTEVNSIDIASYLPFGPSYLTYLSLYELVEGDNGDIWVSLGFYDYRLAKIALNGVWTYYNINDLPFSAGVQNIDFREHQLYVYTYAGLWILNTQSNTWQHYDPSNSPLWNSASHTFMEFDPTGNWWFARINFNQNDNTANRLCKFDGTQWDTIFTPGLSIAGIAFAPDGTPWTATVHIVGMFPVPVPAYFIRKYDGSTWVEMTQISTLLNDESQSVKSLEFDIAGDILIGTSNSGVYKIDTNGLVLEHYTICNSGLVGNYINEIEIDPTTSAIWFATEDGASILTPSSQLIHPTFQPPASICIGAPAPFTNTTLGAISYEWRRNGELISTEQSPMLSFPATGTYIIGLTAFNAAGCTTSTSQAVTVHPVADLSGFPASVVECVGSWQLCAPEGMAFYEWKDGAGTVVSSASCETFDIDDNGTYTLKIKDFCGNECTKAVSISLSGACVRPGDFDVSGRVDFRDVLWLGHTFGYFGTARFEQGIACGEYPSLDWNGHLPLWAGNANFKHCDADGNGGVGLEDWKAIDQNYLACGILELMPTNQSSQYSFVPELDSVGVDSTFFPAKIIYTLRFRIVAQNGGAPGIDHFYGAGMRIYFTLPTGLSLMGTPTFSFANSTLGTEGVDALGLVKVFADKGFMDVAYTRLDHENQSGVSVLGGATFLVIDDNLATNDSLSLSLSILGGTGLTSEGDFLPINGGQGNFNFGDTIITSNHDVAPAGKLTLSPNPAMDVCHLEYVLPAVEEISFRLFNAQGVTLWSANGTGQVFSREIDLSGLPAGVYFLETTGGGELLTNKIVKL